jgi:hypothetical protein
MLSALLRSKEEAAPIEVAACSTSTPLPAASSFQTLTSRQPREDVGLLVT